MNLGNKILSFIGLLLLVSFNTSAKESVEITHLLNYVEATNCQYERNGKFHNGKAAVKHINKKYQYFIDDIVTTEDFIKYSATKSKMSGQYYKIHCGQQKTVKSKDWLLAELKRFRAAKTNSEN